MANVLIEQDTMVDIADAIRGKNGSVSTYTPAQMVTAIANIRGGGLEYETGTYIPSSNIARPTISFSKTHSSMPVFVMMSDATDSNPATSYTNHAFVYADWFVFTGQGVPANDVTNARYASIGYVYRGSSASNVSTNITALSYKSSNTSASTADYPRYWVTESNFMPNSNSTSRYWRSGRAYNWIAVWK